MHRVLGQQKTQAKYLAFWLQSLHLRLKNKHLEKLCAKFQKHVIRRRYLREWIRACTKKIKTDELIKIQERDLLVKCWNALIKNVDSSHHQKRLSQMAS